MKIIKLNKSNYKTNIFKVTQILKFNLNLISLFRTYNFFIIII